MGVTQIKDGYQGGSDNQLKVNPDGSINVNGGGGGGGGNVNITQVGGNTVTNALPVQDEGFSVISVGPTQISVGTTSTQLLAANPNRVYAHIINNTSNAVYLQYSSAAALNQGIKLSAGGFLFISGGDLFLGVVNAIALMPNQLIDVLEGT